MKQESAKIISINTPTDGVWLPASKACRYFRSGKGIDPKTLMNKVYAGKLKSYAKYTPQGWLIFVNNEFLNQAA